MEPNDSDSWDEYPWVPVEHEPPKRKPNKKKKLKDLNKGKVPTAYRIRYAKDGTKWHSIVDILRPDSPPVEWPEYPDRPVQDDFPVGFNWDAISDIDDDPVKCLKKLGIPETDINIQEEKVKKKNSKLLRKIKKLEEKLAKMEAKEDPLNCGPIDPELVDDDNLYRENDKDFASVSLYPTTGYGGGVTRLEEDDYYHHDNDSNNLVQSPKGRSGSKNVTPPRGFGKTKGKEVQYEFDDDSGELSTDGYNSDRQRMWKELQDL